MDAIQTVAQAIWESQRARLKGDGINSRVSWRDPSIPEAFWESYILDAKAALSAEPKQEPLAALPTKSTFPEGKYAGGPQLFLEEEYHRRITARFSKTLSFLAK